MPAVHTERHGRGRVLPRSQAATGGAGAADSSACTGTGHGGAAAAGGCSASTALVLQPSAHSTRPPLPPPRWAPHLRTTPLPTASPGWAEGRAAVRRAVGGGRALLLSRALQPDEAGRAARAVTEHARASPDSPRVAAAWRSRADVNRFLAYCPHKQALEGPYRLRCPDTSPLLLDTAPRTSAPGAGPPAWSAPWRAPQQPAASMHSTHSTAAGGTATALGSAAGPQVLGGGGGGAAAPGAVPRVHQALQCAALWADHRLYVQAHLADIHIRSGSGGGGDGGGGPLVQLEPREGEAEGGRGWHAACMELLGPALRWVQEQLLGAHLQGGGADTALQQQLLEAVMRVYGSSSSSGSSAHAGGCDAAASGGPGCGAALPYSGGSVSLEWCAAGGLLPLRFDAQQDRVLLQLHGRRRVLLVPPEQVLPGLAPFPLMHPLDGYSMPAVAHSLVAETPGVDRQRGEQLTRLWPGFAQLHGCTALLQPGDALLVPRGWALHCEMLPAEGADTSRGVSQHTSGQHPSPVQQQQQQQQQQQAEGQVFQGAENLVMVVSLLPVMPQLPPPQQQQQQRPGSVAAVADRPSPSATGSGAGGSPADSGSAAAAEGTPERRPQLLPAGAAPCPGARLVAVSRLLEGWAVASEVPLARVRPVLLDLACYHEERCALEARCGTAAGGQKQQGLGQELGQGARETETERLNPELPAQGQQGTERQPPEHHWQRTACERAEVQASPPTAPSDAPELPPTNATTASSAPPTTPSASYTGPRAQQLVHPQLATALLRHQLHPLFNTHTPHGRVMMELYDMVVRHVAPLAGAVLAGAGVDADAGGTAGRRTSGGGSFASAASAGAQERGAGDAQGSSASWSGGDGGGGPGPVGSTAVSRLLRLVCTDRLGPTDWVNQLCRDPEVRREQLVWYDDTRTEREARFPELFRLQVAAKEAAARTTSLRLAAPTHGSLIPALGAPGAGGERQLQQRRLQAESIIDN